MTNFPDSLSRIDLAIFRLERLADEVDGLLAAGITIPDKGYSAALADLKGIRSFRKSARDLIRMMKSARASGNDRAVHVQETVEMVESLPSA